MLRFIDIGCDVGESFGVYKYGYDEEVMEFMRLGIRVLPAGEFVFNKYNEGWGRLSAWCHL